MITDAAMGVRLPHADSLNPKVPTALIGRALASTFDETLLAPLPEALAALVRLLEDRERERPSRPDGD